MRSGNPLKRGGGGAEPGPDSEIPNGENCGGRKGVHPTSLAIRSRERSRQRHRTRQHHGYHHDPPHGKDQRGIGGRPNRRRKGARHASHTAHARHAVHTGHACHVRQPFRCIHACAGSQQDPGPGGGDHDQQARDDYKPVAERSNSRIGRLARSAGANGRSPSATYGRPNFCL